MPRKNIQDELRPINHAALCVLFNIALLYRRKVAVKNNQRRVFRIGFRKDFVQLAAAHQRRRVGLVAQLENRARNRSASAAIAGDRKSTRLNSSHIPLSRMPSSA